ncbi:MAG: signal peptide peptidase SppA [Deltaproteobacteria bacterium HGW-Deltaproteobacteria-4]|nr:MAG: signal peptide peptidase SppA [Deltaproteobacteria bacterium HGW-Deltaproteobacteria-4]
MKKNPLVMALLIVGAIFLFFVILALFLSPQSGRSARFSLGTKVGVIEISGVITSASEIIEDLRDFEDDSAIKAIVLRIDSPGGSVAPSQEIHDAIKKTAAIKPVVVSMGSVAASGGYYIAVAAQQIVANPGTMTGSIGVIMEFANYEELLKKIGWQNIVVKSGRFKDIGSPNRPMSAADQQLLQAMIDDVQSQFVDAVAQGRNLSLEEVKKVADGRIMTGRQALAAGLVDKLGGLESAIDLAADLAGIVEPEVIYPLEPPRKLIDYIMQGTADHLFKIMQQQSQLKLNFL